MRRRGREGEKSCGAIASAARGRFRWLAVRPFSREQRRRQQKLKHKYNTVESMLEKEGNRRVRWVS